MKTLRRYLGEVKTAPSGFVLTSTLACLISFHPAISQIQSPALKSHFSESAPYDDYLVTVDEIPLPSLGWVNDIVRDKQGFMWFATSQGLCRYDGIEVKEFSKFRERIRQRKFTTAISESEDGSLLLATWDGVWSFDPKSEQFTPLLPEMSDSDRQIDALAGDAHGRIWIGTRKNGLFEYHRSTRTLKHHTIHTGLSYSKISALVVDDSGVVWIGTRGGGLNSLNPLTGQITRYRLSTAEQKNTINAIHEHNGHLWIGTSDGLSILNMRTGNIRHLYVSSLEQTRIWSITNDEAGVVWIGTQGEGVFTYHDGVLRQFSPTATPLSDAFITNLYVDTISSTHSRLHLWIGTRGGIVSKVEIKKNPFTTSMRAKDRQIINYGAVLSLSEDRHGILWVGLWGGGLEALKPTDNGYKRTAHYYAMLPSNEVVSLLEDHQGILWAGTSGGLASLDPAQNVFTTYKHIEGDSTSLPANGIGRLLEDRRGRIWVCTDSGLSQIVRGERIQFKNYLHPTGDANITRGVKISQVLEDKVGHIWVSTLGNGLLKFDAQENFTRFFNPVDTVGELENWITSFHEDANGKFWLATEAGLVTFDQNTGTFERYNSEELRGAYVTAIQHDGSGNLWLSTKIGLLRLNPLTGTFYRYGDAQGLPFKELISRFYISKSGKWYVGGLDGFTEFFPESVYTPRAPPAVALTGFSVFDEAKPASLLNSPEITLRYDQNFFTLSFAALDYIDPKRNRYKYRLFGIDPAWVDSRHRNYASYTHIDPGEYLFQVKGSNSDDVWNEDGASIRITIHPPWWKTTWAYMGYGLAILGALYSIRRFELNRQGLKHRAELEHVEAEKLRDIDQMKSRFFANISHEFRTPLTLILGPIQKWKAPSHSESRFSGTKNLQSAQEPDSSLRPDLESNRDSVQNDSKELHTDMSMAERNAQRLLRLVNQLLDLSKLEAGQMKLEARETDIAELVREVAAAFESLARRKEIRYALHGLEKPVICFVDKEKMEQVLTNLLSNAFKFTQEGGSVTVTLTPSFGHPSPDGRRDGGEGIVTTTRHPERALSSESKGVQGMEHASTPPDKKHGDSLSMTPKGFVKITVSDTGIGIPADQLDKVFDRFYQTDDSHVREHEGSGIGLALVKELVELHKGKLAVESEPGRGSTFTVQLPLGREHLKPEEIVTPAEKQKAEEDRVVNAEEPETIEAHSTLEEAEALLTRDELPLLLIIEDNHDMRSYIRKHLRDAYKILEAEDGVAGISKAVETIPDLVISDVMMPKMDGFEVCKTLKLDEKTSHIPVILLTAKGGAESKVEGLETGADDYLIKPFDAKELLVRVKNLIEQRRRLRERFRQEITLEPREVAVTSADATFLRRVMETVEQHMEEPEFGVTELSTEVAMSRSQLYRKVRAVTDLSPVDLIRSIRLKRAASLLRQHAGNISEIAYEVGFNNPSYFAECFRKLYGVSPSEYISHPGN